MNGKERKTREMREWNRKVCEHSILMNFGGWHILLMPFYMNGTDALIGQLQEGPQ